MPITKTGELNTKKIYAQKVVTPAPFMIDCTAEFFGLVDPLPNAHLMSCFCKNAPPSRCSLEMFNGDEAAYQTCVATFVMQENWYPDPIGGMFSY